MAPAPPAPFVVLASRSPQRKAILRQLGVPFRVVPSWHAESLAPGAPVNTVIDNALGKARVVAGREAAGLAPGHLILGVDTVVVLDERVMGKAATAAEATAFVTALSGRRHEVESGICLVAPGGGVWTGHARTVVTFRSLAPEAVASYVATQEWRERAGAYAIQGVGSALVTAVEGDYWNVVGLPVALLLDGFEQLGVAPFSWLCGAGRRSRR
ncbi:MAG: nucleoside triphosphate pyrophosphatase [Thermoleophilia bacterium]